MDYILSTYEGATSSVIFFNNLLGNFVVFLAFQYYLNSKNFICRPTAVAVNFENFVDPST